MSNSHRPLVAVPEAEELAISPVSERSIRHARSGSIAESEHALRSSHSFEHVETSRAYQSPPQSANPFLSHDELVFGAASPPSTDELGISMQPTSPPASLRRVPVGRRSSQPRRASQESLSPQMYQDSQSQQFRQHQQPQQYQQLPPYTQSTPDPVTTPGLNPIKSYLSKLTSIFSGRFPWKDSQPLMGRVPLSQQSSDPDYLLRNVAPMGDSAASSTRPTPNMPYQSSLEPHGELADENYDDETFHKKYYQVPRDCSSRRDIHVKRGGWISVTVLTLSVYSTIMSAIWVIVAILQPKWNRGISSNGKLTPSNATLLTTLLAKTIEMSFVAVFIACIGQVFSRRALVRKSRGITLAEVSMRNFVVQPGLLITHFKSLPYAATTILGSLCLVATLGTMFFTTASDAMVSPKLKFSDWQPRQMRSTVRASYANAMYIKETCPTLLGDVDKMSATESCVNVEFSGSSYRNLLSLMTTWNEFNINGSIGSKEISERPTGSSLLNNDITVTGSWIETEHGDVEGLFKKTGRIINNVTLAMPHPGVYAAAISNDSGILQPDDLAGVGEYAIKAAVVSPTVNALCVEVTKDDIKPLVYTDWPDARTEKSGVGKQLRGKDGWEADVPPPTNEDGEPRFLNSTDLDDIFLWGRRHNRQPPVFPMYPNDFNIIVNSTSPTSDSLYLIGKDSKTTNYTVCEMRSWLSPKCSTYFSSSGLSGSHMMPNCEDPEDEMIYLRNIEKTEWGGASPDWKWIADAWRLSMDLNGGVFNSNASNARILTQLALHKPKLPTHQPSLAEALAIYASSTVITSAIDAPFVHYWGYKDAPNNILPAPGSEETFSASVTAQAYTSGHTQRWQGIFYIILVSVFGINLFCLFYFIMRAGMVTDFTEPLNMFALALNSPPSAQLYGSCGGGPKERDLVVPWRVAYAPSANHYFFEEANDRPWRGKYVNHAISTGPAYSSPEMKNDSYKRLSAKRGFL